MARCMRIPGRPQPASRRAGPGLILAALLLAAPATAAEPEVGSAHGREIYHEGTSDGAPIRAEVGRAGIELAASSFPCVSCHGADGRGREESGVLPSDIRWARLTRGYGGEAPSGRRFPAYDEASLVRAIRTGVDPGGNRLDPAMPRFDLDDAEAAALVDYLRQLERDLDPGIGADRLVVATIVPSAGPLAPAGAAASEVLRARFAEINAEGGLYGRRLALEVRQAATPTEAVEIAEQLMTEGEVFALVAAFTQGVDGDIARLAERHGVPLVAPVTAQPPVDADSRRFTFYLYGGPRVQAQALVDYALTSFPDASLPLAVVHTGTETALPLARAVHRQARERGLMGLRELNLAASEAPAADLRALAEAGTPAVFFLGGGAALRQWLSQATAIGFTPYVYTLGGLAGQQVLQAPEAFHRRLYLAFPTGAADVSPEGRAAFGAFHRRHELPREALPSQMTAYVAAELLLAGLRRSGRALTREQLVGALEDMSELDTGLMPPLRFGGTRRTGARGAHVVSVDLHEHRLAAGSVWVEPR